jgi:eukaryotic-like serine/threonine-protein kinase
VSGDGTDDDDADEQARISLGIQPTVLPDPPAPGPASTQLLTPDRRRTAVRNTVADTVAPLDHHHDSDFDRTAPRDPRALLTMPLEGRGVPRDAPTPRELTLISAATSGGAKAQLGQILGGKYELVRLLGAGGMGSVWKAQHLSLGVTVAVKTMHPHVAMQDEYVRRFRREAHAASLLNHPNVVRVLDFGEEGRLLYLVMEYLDGRSLGSWLDRLDAPPPLAEVGRILAMLLDAFAVAHAYGIVHRDLKPDNVFLADVGDQRVVKVLDFGLAHVDDARDAGPTLTQRDAVAGTPDYMSPEQCRSLAVGPSADLYSLGCLLTTMLQLRPPFSGGASIDTMAKHMFAKPPPLKRPQESEPVPPLLEKLRLDLLAKVAERRPADALETKKRLLEALSPEATLARLPTRKGEVALGDRSARAPSWTPAPRAPIAPDLEIKRIGVLRLPPPVEAVGIDESCETALAAQQIEMVAVRAAAEIAAMELSLVVLDVGTGIHEGRAALEEIRRVAPRAKVIVCAGRIGADQLNELVAAGAADVARYPITPDGLARKIDRVLRRGR